MEKGISNKEIIEKLLNMIKRPGIDKLLQWMDENGFYTVPCSSKYHLAKPGGLAEHSLNVYRIAIDIGLSLYTYPNKINQEMIDSIVICGLLHDLGKTGQFGKPNYIMNSDLTFPEYETNKELLYVPHEVRSVAIASKFIDLTEDEQFAILYHNGLYGELKTFKGHETPLYMILHFADMWASRVVESRNTKTISEGEKK